MSRLPGGTCDVIVVEAGNGAHGDLEIHAAITLGPRRTEAARLRGDRIENRRSAPAAGEPTGVLGLPRALPMRAGEPTVRLGA